MIDRCIKIARKNAYLRWIARKILRIIQLTYKISRFLVSVKQTRFACLRPGTVMHYTGRLLLRVGEYRLIKHAHAAHLAENVVLLQAIQNIKYDAPELFGPLPSGWPEPWNAISVKFPALVATEWSKALFLGRSDSVYVKGFAIHNDNWNPQTELTYDEVRHFLVCKKDTILLRSFADRKSHTIDRAIVIVGGVTPNWAHWTTEYLPKIALVDMEPLYHSWPLVVDANLPKNMLDSLKLVGSIKREIIELPEGELLYAKQAVTITSPGYSAYEYRYDRNRELPNFKREDTRFSPFALNLLRERAWHSLDVVPNPTRRLYITRPVGSMRPFKGAEEVEAFFISKGFEIICTSHMSFEEQVRLFASAICIVGQSGAGMVNLVYAPPGCTVIVFAANSQHSIFHYFANMGPAANHKIFYCYGESIYTRCTHPGHAGFSVEIADVHLAWNKIKHRLEYRQHEKTA